MGKTILLVDDVRLFIEMQREFLQYSSVQVLTAKNGVEALDTMGSTRPDLVLMDLEMPEMDGISCCRAIKTTPELASIPVVMITAKGDEASLQQCRAAGCDGFLTKPLNRTLFLETAGRFVSGIDRREKRMPTKLPAQLRLRGTASPCTLYDLSLGGAFVASDLPAEIDRVVDLSFSLPDGSTQECRAKVVWGRAPDAPGLRGFGVNFVLLPPGARKALAGFLLPVTPRPGNS